MQTRMWFEEDVGYRGASCLDADRVWKLFSSAKYAYGSGESWADASTRAPHLSKLLS